MIGRYILITFVLIFLFSGCSKIVNVGYDKTVCEEQDCDYSDAGVCGNSYDIYRNWKKVKQSVYSNYSDCKKHSY